MYAGEEEREAGTRECSSSKMAGCKVAMGSTWLACHNLQLHHPGLHICPLLPLALPPQAMP